MLIAMLDDKTRQSIGKSEFFTKATLFLLGYTFFIVLWGAWVRISHSGDGCGKSWPLCHGEILPKALGTSSAISIEFFHRFTSGLYGILILGLFIWALRLFPSGHGARKGALLCVIFTLTEALIGAFLVLKGLVVENATPLRALSMGLHLINTFFLTGSLTLTWHLSQYQRPQWNPPPKPVSWLSLLALVFFFILSSSGAIAALASQLFPSSGLYEGLLQDFSLGEQGGTASTAGAVEEAGAAGAADAADAADAAGLGDDSPSPISSRPWLLQWRILHPFLGLSSLLVFGALLTILKREGRLTGSLHWTLPGCIALGLSSLLLLSPLWAKLSHLLLAHLFYFSLLKWLLPAFTANGKMVSDA